MKLPMYMKSGKDNKTIIVKWWGVLYLKLRCFILSHVISCHYDNSFFWIRIFKYGICIKDTNRHRLLFSDRNGSSKKLMIGKWCVKYLPPNN